MKHNEINKKLFPTTITITQVFGWRFLSLKKKPDNHYGIDIANVIGTDIKAADDGIIRIPDFHKGYGNRVYIFHSDNSMSYYSHLSEITVKESTKIIKGQVIAKMGNTGEYTTGPHLHYGLKYKNKWVDPLDYMDIPDNVKFHEKYITKTENGLINTSSLKIKEKSNDS